VWWVSSKQTDQNVKNKRTIPDEEQDNPIAEQKEQGFKDIFISGIYTRVRWCSHCEGKDDGIKG